MNSNHTPPHLLKNAPPSQDQPLQRRSKPALHLRQVAGLVLAWLLALFSPLPANSQSYTATSIQPAAGSFEPANVNDVGEVVGHFPPNGGYAVPVLWRAGTFTELPLLPGTIGGFAKGINNVGQIVGSCYDSNGAYQACIWQNGSVSPLASTPGATESEAIDINDAGGATGYAIVPGGVYPDGTPVYRRDAVVWQAGTVQVIVLPDYYAETYARAIDATGRVALSVYDDWFGGWLPGRWTPDAPNGMTGAFEILDWSGGFGSDINDSGVVCGYDGPQRAALWNGTTATVIGVLPGSVWALATGINRAGTVAGYSVAYYETYVDYTAFVWDAARGMRDLNALLSAPSAQFGKLTEALAINNAGQILAAADNGCVLLTPSNLPPPLPAPTALASQSGNNWVALSWDPVAIASGYNVKRATVSGGPYTAIATGVASTSYVDSTAVNGMRYYYVVSALADTRESANSNETTARPLAPPLAPSGLAAKEAHAKVTLTWRQSTSPEVLRNRIYRSTNGGPFARIADIPAGLTWTDNQARSKTNYTYLVTAVNSIGLEGPYSNSATARPK